ncbi:MAG: DUF1573 domain-containing protein [Bacteroidales bacterium]|nr:DUF1573 domain-containing protein [Bacteroidales bacterium]
MNTGLKYLISAFVILFFVSCNTKGTKTETNQRAEKHAVTSLSFNETEFDFGTITSGEVLTHRFIFKNTGNAVLYISKVMADCGCTVADYEKAGIEPGKEGYIELVFNSDGFHGLQIKKVNVYANTNPAVHELTIAATVE